MMVGLLKMGQKPAERAGFKGSPQVNLDGLVKSQITTPSNLLPRLDQFFVYEGLLRECRGNLKQKDSLQQDLDTLGRIAAGSLQSSVQ